METHWSRLLAGLWTVGALGCNGCGLVGFEPVVDASAPEPVTIAETALPDGVPPSLWALQEGGDVVIVRDEAGGCTALT